VHWKNAGEELIRSDNEGSCYTEEVSKKSLKIPKG
jgi:hypothetical protein